MSAPGFGGITGHEDIIRQMREAAGSGRINHAYLITGEEGMGKKTLAEAFAMALVCEHEDPGMRPCLSCSACRRAAAKSHPDIIYVTHEKPRIISVDDVRDQIVATADILPYEGGRKIYIIPDAEKMNASAQNAFLKTLEEPPDYVVLLLLAANPDPLLPTILSRCIRMPLRPVPDRLVDSYIREKLELPDYEAKVITAYAQGNIGKAVRAAREGAFADIRDQAVALAKGLGQMNVASLREAVRRLKEEKDHTGDTLDIMLLFFRDVLYYKASADIDAIVFANEISAIRDMAKRMSYEGILSIYDAIEKCRIRIAANVNPELAIELLLLAIRENSR